MSSVNVLGLIERDELIERLIEADEALFEDGGAISHRDSAEAVVRVVEDYIDQRLRGAVARAEALERELGYALDALEGKPWTGWSTDTARDTLQGEQS